MKNPQDYRNVQIPNYKTMKQYLTSNQIDCHLYSSHAHLLAHLVSEALFPVTQILPVILCQFVSTVGAVRKAVMMPLFLGSVVAITLSPSGLFLVPHELVKVVVVSLSFPLIIFASVVLLSLSATVLLPLLLVAVSLPSSGEKGGLTIVIVYVYDREAAATHVSN